MNIINTVIGAVIAVTQSKWIQPALMTLAILATVLVVTACKPHH